jgi:hypothetical protein
LMFFLAHTQNVGRQPCMLCVHGPAKALPHRICSAVVSKVQY